jgi:hypothetical protein
MTREDRAEAQLGLRRETGWFWTFIQVEIGDGILSAIDVSRPWSARPTARTTG